MRILLIGAILAAAAAAPALAEDNEAGVPLTPTEAAGAWTVSTNGRDVCIITLTAAHGVKAPAACQGLLPSPTAWKATSDGMALSGGTGWMAFHRWSNSLFVSSRASGLDVQLRRGGPVPLGREPEG
jgi:hypothetical protein